MANKEALKALQQRLATRLQQVREHRPERNWLAVDMGGHGFLLPLEQAGEIFPLSLIQAVPHSQPWFKGVANLRGQLHGVVDLAGFMGLPTAPMSGGTGTLKAAPSREAARLLALNQGLQLNAALLVDRLMGLRSAANMSPAAQPQAVAPHYVTQQLRDEHGQPWYELDLAALVSDEAFMKIDA